MKWNHHVEIIDRRPEAIDATDTGDNNHIVAADQGTGGQQSQAIDFFIDGGILFNVDVALRNVGFGLIVVVIADEVCHRIVREELAKLAVQLCGQSFIVRQNKSWPLNLLDDVGHRKRLARSGDSQQHLSTFVVFDALNK